MKDLGRTLLGEAPFAEIMIGNAAVARAMMEAGVRVVTSYPGSPTPEIAEAIKAIPPESRPFRFEFSTNEKVALEVAFGAAVNGHSSVVFFKSVGLNVAADSFVQLPLMDIPGGMVVLLGDDPGANSSQNEQDNRHYAKLSYMPLLEPATAQEAYLMTKEAVALARRERTAVILRLTTHVCHAKERIQFGPYRPEPLDPTPRFDPEAANYIPIAASVFPMKRKALARLERLAAEFSASPLNRVLGSGKARRGVVVAGTARLSLLDALEDARGAAGAAGPDAAAAGGERPDILELGTVHPLPRRLLLDFLASHEEVKILEELDPVIEEGAKALAYDAGLRTRIIGKVDPEERIGEYVPDKVRAILAANWPDLCRPPKAPNAPTAGGRPVPVRPAQLCPGCGHRSAFHAIKKALKETDITVADIGCHTLGHLPPYKMGRVLLSMGHSTPTASGLALFNDARKVLCFLGDSTFFHAAMPGIVNAVYNGHELVLVVMENGTTAMTGHQDHPAAGRNFQGAAPKIPVRQALEGLGVTNIREVDTYKQAELTEAVRAALAEPGFNVVIAKHPCMLKFTREARRKPGWTARHVSVSAACTRAYVCASSFACPSFQVAADGSVSVHPDLCIGDGSCRQVCPSGALTDPSRGV